VRATDTVRADAPPGEAMLRLAGVVISVGLADSLNPSTVGPALYFATGQRRVVRVLLFTVNLAAGIVLTIGPGRLLLGLVPHPRRNVRHVIELVAGVLLLAISVARPPLLLSLRSDRGDQAASGYSCLVRASLRGTNRAADR
jgi:hypothetical protein